VVLGVYAKHAWGDIAVITHQFSRQSRTLSHSLTYNAGWPQREAVVGARSSVMLTVFLQLFFTLTQAEGGRSDGAQKVGMGVE
jgi:hypothetical protein